jgi:fucose 4-O-acetylase-like acetyltransferase
MKTRLAQVGVAIAVLAAMWVLLLLVGSTGRVGEVEVLIWLGLLVAAEMFAVRWTGRRLRASASTPAAPVN